MYIYNLISITLITAPSLRSPLPLLSLQFFLVRLTLHVHGVGLWAVEILTAHIASVACGWGRLTGRVFSIGRFVWLVFNCKRQMTSYEDYDSSKILKDSWMTSSGIQTTGPQLGCYLHAAPDEWLNTWVKTNNLIDIKMKWMESYQWRSWLQICSTKGKFRLT